MARYNGPVCRICRRAGEKLFLKGDKCFTKCTLDKRPSPPGQHTKRWRKLSDRGLQLREKQKARYIYGCLERQFKKTFAEAEKRPGVTGDTLQLLLEKRLDNVIFRLGFADSRPQARQLVLHGHIFVNGKRTDIPSSLVKPGDVIAWREGSKKTKYYEERAGLLKKGRELAGWLSLDTETLSARVLKNPTKEDLAPQFDAQAVVAYYSR